MATGDKVVTLAGLKAVYDSQDTDSIKQDVADLKSSLFTTKNISGNPVEILRAVDGSDVKLSVTRGSSSVSSASLRVSGRNLGKVRDIRSTSNGITFTYNDDGSVTCSGTASANAYTGPGVAAEAIDDMIPVPAGTYILSGINEEDDIRIGYNIVDSNKTELVTAGNIRASNPTLTFTVNVPAYVYLRVMVPSGNTVSNATVYPMLEVGTTYHDFEAVSIEAIDVQFTGDTETLDAIKAITPYMCVRSTADVAISAEYTELKNSALIFRRPLRILQITDTHYSTGNIYATPSQERMQQMVEWILEEHQKNPIDVIIHTGDVSYNNLYTEGTDTNFIQKFVDEFAAQLPCPIYAIPGNHDGYTDEQWMNAFGTKREFIVDTGDCVLAMLDTFGMPTDSNTGGTYKGPNIDCIKSAINLSNGRPVFLFGHHFNYTSDSAEVQSIIEDTPNIVGLFCGHKHIPSFTTYGTKPLVIAGHMAFAMVNSSPVLTYDNTNSDAPWSYNVIDVIPSGLKVRNIKPAYRYFTYASDTYTAYDYAGSETQTILRSDEVVCDYSVDKYLARDAVPNFSYRQTSTDNVVTLGLGKNLPYGSDLNNCNELGVWYSENTAKTSSISNKPSAVTAGFKLITYKATSNISSPSYLMQAILSANAKAPMFFRSTSNGGSSWTSWYRVITDSDFDALEARVSALEN